MIELTTAIKCPNINTFLCTFKIFQFHLQNPEVIKKFIPVEELANDISRFFAKIISLRDLKEEEKEKLYKEIEEDIGKYIVKPMKEGGGNNYYNQAILDLLPNNASDPAEILHNSIIMERVSPPESDSVVLIENKAKSIKTITEISIYGLILSDDKNIYVNKSAGYLLRTKEKSNQEGGVMSGSSAIDIPCLFDDRGEKNGTI